jgi:hypothetical protein
LNIEEWGEVELQVNTPSGRQPLNLIHVAYIPGFFTSVLSLSRFRGRDIHFDSGSNCLYQRARSNPACYLEYKDGNWLEDADISARPSPKASIAVARYSSKPSYKEKKPFKLSSEQAHRLLSHVSYEAVSHLPRSVDRVELIQEQRMPYDECTVCIKLN